jgi:hypothetical protein
MDKMSNHANIFLPVIENHQVEKLNMALQQVLKQVKQVDAKINITHIEDCLLYSLELRSNEIDIKTIDILCDSLTTKFLGVKSKKCFTNVIGKMKDGLDILSYREINIED